MTIPTVGESITEVTVATWLKNDGDFVEMDEVLCELESDKATFELPAEASGILRIKAEEGATIEIGALICEIEESDGSAQNTPKEEVKEESQEEAKLTGEVFDMVIPTVGESITEVTIASWLKEDGDFVELDEILCEIESDKATFEFPSEANGILRIVAQEGDTLEIGALLAKVEVMSGAPSAKKESSTSVESNDATPVSQNSTYASGHASPAAAKILAEKGIDPKDVVGTGVDGRITKEDAEKAQKKAKPAPAPKKEEVAEAPKRVAGSRNQRREKMSSLRRTIAKRLVAVKSETAMLTTFNEVDMTAIFEMRKKYKEAFKEKYGTSLGFMSFFSKACAMALNDFPGVNAMIDGREIVYNDFVDISIAVSTPKGLVVPVVRNVESMHFDEIEKEIKRLAIRGRDGKLTIPEMTGGTFTITNGGVFGSMLSTPIINAPQSAILGMHNIVQRPMAVNGEVKIRPITYLALSYDHRIVDGKESVSFLVRVKELLEAPERMLFGI